MEVGERARLVDAEGVNEGCVFELRKVEAGFCLGGCAVRVQVVEGYGACFELALCVDHLAEEVGDLDGGFASFAHAWGEVQFEMGELGRVEEERAYVVGEAEGIVVGHCERAKVGKGRDLLGFNRSSG